MPGEIGHVVYAARVLTNLSAEVRDQAYWVGTLFPNIRSLGIRSRHPLHVEDVSLHSLVGDSAFVTGMRVHGWLDIVHSQFFNTTKIREGLPWHPSTSLALSLYEDELLYEHFEDWDLIYRLLNTPSPDELFYVTDKKAVQRWHSLLQNYCARRPTARGRQAFLLDLGLSRNLVDETLALRDMLAKQKAAQSAVYDYWHYLESILQ